jgi:hypothetical protein
MSDADRASHNQNAMVRGALAAGMMTAYLVTQRGANIGDRGTLVTAASMFGSSMASDLFTYQIIGAQHLLPRKALGILQLDTLSVAEVITTVAIFNGVYRYGLYPGTPFDVTTFVYYPAAFDLGAMVIQPMFNRVAAGGAL